MNPGQLAQQVKHLLASAAWDDGCLVFGESGVSVIAGTPTQPPTAYPWALVSIGAGEFDDEEPEMLRQSIGVYTGVRLAGDDLGEHAVIGGALGANGSGRGIVEVDEIVRATVGRLTGADGCSVTLSASSVSGTGILEDNRALAFGELTLSAVCTSLPSFASPHRLKVSGGTWTWDGSECESRYDFVEYLLVDSPGPGPAASPSAGDTVYQGTAATTDAAVSGVATVFAAYGDRGTLGSSSTATDYSRPIRGTYV